MACPNIPKSPVPVTGSRADTPRAKEGASDFAAVFTGNCSGTWLWHWGPGGLGLGLGLELELELGAGQPSGGVPRPRPGPGGVWPVSRFSLLDLVARFES